MMKQKKGVESVVVWIMLIGFAITMTAMVFVVEKRTAKELTKSTVESGESKMECNIAAINVKCEECSFFILNTGKISIAGVVFRDNIGSVVEFGVKQKDTGFPMRPGDAEPFIAGPRARNPAFDTSQGIEIIPMISVSEKLYGCNDKVIAIKAGDLKNCGC